MNQIKAGGPVTLTDPGMSRFIMSLQEAAALVMESVFMAQGGEVFVTKMKALRIIDLAEVMIDALAPQFGYDPKDITLQVTGTRPGEKLHEELVNTEEIRRTLELEDYFVVTPAFKSLYRDIRYVYPGFTIKNTVSTSYNSRNQPFMSKKEIRSYLLKNELIKLNDYSVEIQEEISSCVS